MTTQGLRWVSTVMPPSTAWSGTAPSSSQESRTRSGRRGRWRQATSTVITPTAISTVMSIRLPSSIQWW